MKAIKIIILFTLFYTFSNAQPYVYLDTEIKGLIQSNANWLDVNNDGYPDLIVSGERYSANKQIIKTHLYLNNRKGGFLLQNSGLHQYYRSAIDWVDIDSDGDLDVLISGETADHNLQARIYKNNGQGYFSSYNAGILPMRDGDLKFGDFNKDGKQDILAIGENNGKLYSRIYQNINNAKFVDIKANLLALYGGSAEWGDYDNDGDLDILISGENLKGIAFTKIYQNNGNNDFQEIETYIEGVKSGKAIFADFDNDKDLDVFVCGENSNFNLIAKIYRNDGNNKFIEVPSTMLGMRFGNVEANDFDCDGDIDLLVSGESFYGPSTKIYRNESKFVFSDVKTQLPGVYMGGAYWADFDNDCDYDLFLIGLDDCYDFEAKLFRDESPKEKIKQPVAFTKNLWIQNDISYTIRKSYYYFVWASCYCDPQGLANKNYHVFVSNIHIQKRTYGIQERFNSLIRSNIENWAQINGGNRVSIGYKTMQEALEGRKHIIRDYQSEDFKVSQVNW